jgi:hypothetical protein
VNVDEMDLVSQALEVTPWRPEAYERARTTLRGAMAESEYRQEAAPMPEVTPLRGRGSFQMGNRRRRTMGTRGKVGIGAGIAAVAAGVAAALVITSAPSATPTSTGVAVKAPGAQSNSHPATATAELMSLSTSLAAESKPTGDATLIERKSGVPGTATINVWDLYADDGQYFFSRTKAGLPAQVAKDNDQGGAQFARDVAAAIYAVKVKGNLDAAGLKMAWAANGTKTPAWLSAQVKDIKVGGTQIDNYIWGNCYDALIAGSGNPQVRAGVLRLVSALPDITVTKGTVDGKPALTITAGAGELGYTGYGNSKANPKAAPTGPAYHEAITINASTGIPLEFASGPTGNVTPGVTYVVTRVSLADIKGGKF